MISITKESHHVQPNQYVSLSAEMKKTQRRTLYYVHEEYVLWYAKGISLDEEISNCEKF